MKLCWPTKIKQSFAALRGSEHNYIIRVNLCSFFYLTALITTDHVLQNIIGLNSRIYKNHRCMHAHVRQKKKMNLCFLLNFCKAKNYFSTYKPVSETGSKTPHFTTCSLEQHPSHVSDFICCSSYPSLRQMLSLPHLHALLLLVLQKLSSLI